MSGGPAAGGNFRDSPGASGYMPRADEMPCVCDGMFLMGRYRYSCRASTIPRKDLETIMASPAVRCDAMQGAGSARERRRGQYLGKQEDQTGCLALRDESNSGAVASTRLPSLFRELANHGAGITV